jgi:hypothetical protein
MALLMHEQGTRISESLPRNTYWPNVLLSSTLNKQQQVSLPHGARLIPRHDVQVHPIVISGRTAGTIPRPKDVASSKPIIFEQLSDTSKVGSPSEATTICLMTSGNKSTPRRNKARNRSASSQPWSPTTSPNSNHERPTQPRFTRTRDTAETYGETNSHFWIA